MQPALAEAGRVISSNGRTLVIELLPIESFFQAFRLVEDETVVLAAAQFAIKRAVEQRTFAVTGEREYVRRELFEGFEQFVKRVSVADLSRERVICERKAEIEAAFLELRRSRRR